MFQARQASPLQDREAQGLRAYHGTAKAFFRNWRPPDLLQDQGFNSAKFGFKPNEAAGSNQIDCPGAGGLRGAEIPLPPSDICQQSQESGKRKAELDRVKNLNSTLYMLGPLVEPALLSQSPA
jgi:hypothetical protein